MIASLQPAWRLAQRLTHWAALCTTLAGAGLALYLINPPEWSAYYIRRYQAGIEAHKLLGLAAGLSVLALARMHSRRPAREGGPIGKRLAAIVQMGLLLLAPITALTGYIASSFYGGTLVLPLLGLARSPLPYSERWGAPMTAAHDVLAYLLLALIACHLAGAIKHVLSGAGHVVRRMLFGGS